MTENQTEIWVTPDRVLVKCDHIEDGDHPGMYGFMILVLDEEKTVITVAQTNILDQEGCQGRSKKIGRILKNGKIIYIGGMGTMKEPRIIEKWTYHFPNWGTFSSNGRGLQFIVISNENGECYGAYDGTTPPCSKGEFPIK